MTIGPQGARKKVSWPGSCFVMFASLISTSTIGKFHMSHVWTLNGNIWGCQICDRGEKPHTFWPAQSRSWFWAHKWCNLPWVPLFVNFRIALVTDQMRDVCRYLWICDTFRQWFGSVEFSRRPRYSLWCRATFGDEWTNGLCGREIEQLDLLWHMTEATIQSWLLGVPNWILRHDAK